MSNGFIELVKKQLLTLIYIATGFLVSTGYISTDLNKSVSDGMIGIKENLHYESRKPFYMSVEYGLQKQQFKLKKDPEDIKPSDLEMYYTYCQEEFGIRYTEELPPARKFSAKNGCSIVSNLYTHRNEITD